MLTKQIMMRLATDDALNANINEVKSKIPSISGLAAAVALNTVKNEISHVSDLVKKADYVAMGTYQK